MKKTERVTLANNSAINKIILYIYISVCGKPVEEKLKLRLSECQIN